MGGQDVGALQVELRHHRGVVGRPLLLPGVAVDAAGNVYGAEVGPRALKKYVRP